MRIKLDENLPVRLGDLLAALGHDVDTVFAEGMSGSTDPDVWRATQAAGRFFITQDLDFSDVRVYQPGTHEGILVVRLRVPSRQALADKIRAIFAAEDVESWAGCFVVATHHKIRVRKP
jgi:predicted nuclease of predicted toxin-antitoxin system